MRGEARVGAVESERHGMPEEGRDGRTEGVGNILEFGVEIFGRDFDGMSLWELKGFSLCGYQVIGFVDRGVVVLRRGTDIIMRRRRIKRDFKGFVPFRRLKGPSTHRCEVPIIQTIRITWKSNNLNSETAFTTSLGSSVK
jgi:hypothetical protein